MLDESDYTEKTGRDLLAVTSELGIEAGWAAFDHGDHELARRAYGEAQLLATSSGDAELQTHATIFMAWQATHLAGLPFSGTAKGYAREALRLAAMAEAVARHEPSPRLHACIALRHAAAYAALGDTSAFRAAVGRARRELDRGDHPCDTPWTAFNGPGEVAAVESIGYLRLGDPGRSIALRQGALGNPGLSPRARIVGEGNLAEALLAAGDRTEAINTGRAILPALATGKITSARPLVTLEAVRAAAEHDGDEEFCGHFAAAAKTLAT